MMFKLAEAYKNAGGNDLCGDMAKDLIAVTKNYEKYSNLDQEFTVETMGDRIRKIITLSDAYIILPGGYGTFEEIGSIIGGQQINFILNRYPSIILMVTTTLCSNFYPKCIKISSAE